MAEEAVQLIQSIQWNGSELTNVDTGALAKLHAVLLDNEAGTSMIASRSEMSTSLPQHLVSIINSPVISAKNRFVALGILVALSRTPDDHYRSQILFPVVLTLDASFEGLLTDKKDSSRQFGIAMGKPYEHLVVLLLRVTNYSLRAADILQQLCDNDDTMLSQLLLDMVRVKTYEWPLVVAILRCLHELTLPQTYFTAADSEETVQVHAFQQKVSTIVIHFMQGNTLRNFGDELTERFTTCLRQSHDVIVASLPHFAVVLKYFSGVLMNLEDFCGKPQLQKTYQQSMIVQLSSTITDCLVSFVLAAANYSPLLVSPRGSESAAMCSAIMGCLKVIRYAFYKVRILPPHLVFSLGALADIAISRLAIFRQPPLIPALLLIVETFVNVDAIIHPELGPKVQLLLAAITADTAAAGPTGATLGNTLSTLYLNEQSVFVVMENDTSRAVTGSLCSSALDDLVDEIIQYIDRELVLLGLGQAVFDFFVAPSDPQDLVFVPTPTGPEAITVGSQSAPTLVAPPAAPVSPSLVPTEVKKPKHKKRAVHPPEYVCMLSGKLMREPVVLRNGNRFELEELERIISTMGHVDPISGDTFDDDPEVNMKLLDEIQRYKVRRAAKRDQ